MEIFSSSSNNHVSVRWAEKKDITAVKQLADDNRHALGFVVQASLEERLRSRELLVCEHQNKVIGFVSFHHRRDGWTTIYDLCVEEALRGKGFGRALVEAIQEQAHHAGQEGIRLKCPVNLPANGFYARLGFARVAIEEGKRRPLVVWEKPIHSVGCQSIVPSPTFFLTLTHTPWEIRKIIRLWNDSGDKRDPFSHVIFTPLFSKPAAITVIRQIKDERNSIVMFDSGGYQVQMGRVTYEELFDRLLHFYRENTWADWYVLPDHVPRSTDTDHEVEIKVQETIDFARLFLRRMPEEFAEKAIGVVHGRTKEQVRRCVEAYAAMGASYLGFGSFGTSGPNGTVNLISQRSLNLLRFVQALAHEHGLRLHIFGIGSPSHLIRLANAGIAPTSFDSAGWWKAAGFGKVFFPAGQQLHITRMDGYNATQCGIEREKQRTRHDCAFCANISQLRRRRMMRVMHNLTAMLDTTQRVGKS
jgi:queuine/archaeosine tRNA-ribosyltransferase